MYGVVLESSDNLTSDDTGPVVHYVLSHVMSDDCRIQLNEGTPNTSTWINIDNGIQMNLQVLKIINRNNLYMLFKLNFEIKTSHRPLSGRCIMNKTGEAFSFYSNSNINIKQSQSQY